MSDLHRTYYWPDGEPINDDQEVYWLFTKHESCPLEDRQLIFGSENWKYLDTYTKQNAILGKSRNDLIRKWIVELTSMLEN